jgi:TP901 family phage tail tape measure protein
MLARIGIGAVFSAKVAPLLKGLSKGKTAYQQFGAGAAKVIPPINNMGAAVNSASTRVKTGIDAMMTKMKAYGPGVVRMRDVNSSFVSSAPSMVGALNRIKMAMGGVAAAAQTAARRVGAGMGKIKSGMMGAAMGAAPMTLAIGAGAKAAMDFEKQMSAVGAVSRANATEMSALSKEAKRMGIVSAFSATQSAEGMENLARAGAKPQEIIAGLGGVMNAAATDGIELAQSSDVVARVVKGMGLEWKDAGHITDTLALASAKSNTNILGLGEAFVYGSSTARQLGITLEEQTAIFGKLADAGLRGSMAGTSFSNMMAKMTSKGKAADHLKKFNIQLTNADGSMRNIATIAQEFNAQLLKIPDVTKRNTIAVETFGLRGAKAFSALAAAGADATNQLEQDLLKASQGEGAAQEMANRRLDNMLGKLTLLKSSLEGAAIGIFGPLMGQFAQPISLFTDALNGVLMALEDINEVYEGLGTSAAEWEAVEKKHGKTVWAIAMGIADATNAIGAAWEWVVEKFNMAGEWMQKTFGDDGLRTLSKFMVLLATGAAVAAPIILSLMTVGWVVGGLVSIISGLASVIAGLFWPVLIGGAAVYALWRMLRTENESFGETAMRVWGNIKTWAIDVWENALYPFYLGVKETLIPGIEQLGVVFDEVLTGVKRLFVELFGFMFEGTDMTVKDWKKVGTVIAAVFMAIAETVLTVISWIIQLIVGIVKAVKWTGKAIWTVFDAVGTFIAEHFAKIALGFQDLFGGNFVRGLKRIGLALLDGILTPLQLIVKGAVELADALDIDIPKGIRDFAKGGLTQSFGLGTPDDVWANAGAPPKKKRRPKVSAYNPDDMFETGNYDAAFGVAKSAIDLKGAEFDATSGDHLAMKEAVKEGVKEGSAEAPNETTINLDNKMCVSGEDVARAVSRHKIEIQERAGFKSTPWQRRQAAEHGSILTAKTS